MYPKSHLSTWHKAGFGLLTDLYQLTMAYGYWKNNLHDKEVVFHLFYRKNPFKGHYAVSAGLALIIDYLENLKFTVQDIQYLGSLKGSDGKALFNESFLNYLQRMEFQCDVDAVPEGQIVFPHQPIVRIKGPWLQAQLIETALLNIINFSTLIATKSARIVQAAEGDSVFEFGMRRAQGLDGSITASRSAYIGGCHGTSNVMAGRLYGIPIKGTHAHSWVMGFENELEAFESYAEAMPNNCIFLVDTYDTIQGVKNAIKLGAQLRSSGHEMIGIRLDSGDLAALSKKTRSLLNGTGFKKAVIVASNDLDEYRIKELKAQGAQIDVWGIGTRLATAYDQAALGGVYKLSAIKNRRGQWEYKVKLSEEMIKVSNPGILQVQRFYDENGLPLGDMLVNMAENTQKRYLIDQNTNKVFNFEGKDSQHLLKPIFSGGKRVYESPSIDEIRAFSLAQQALFSKVDVENYAIGLEENLFETKTTLIEQNTVN
jgi:nicotinate phosphoribosyltransferase